MDLKALLRSQLFAVMLLVGFSIWFSSDLFLLKQGFYHPDFATYYFPYRHWFTQQLSHGVFPLWNPYFGIGTTSHIWATFPVDIYTLFEFLVGPQYHVLAAVQLLFFMAAGYYAFILLGFSPLVAVFAILTVFLSPWVTHYYFYFINTNSFISYLLLFGFLNRWLETQHRGYLFGIFFVTVFSFFGTKPEYWYFQSSTFAFMSLAGGWLLLKNRMITTQMRTKALLGLPVMFLLLAVLANTWQLNMIVRIMSYSERQIPSGLNNLLSWTLYGNLTQSIIDSTFWNMTGLGLFFLLCCRVIKDRTQHFVAKGVVAVTFIGAAGFVLLRIHGDLLGVNNPALWSSALAFLIIIFVLRTKSTAENILKAFFLSMPFLYYFGRGVGLYADEVELIKDSPLIFRVMILALLTIGLLEFNTKKHVVLAYLAAVFVFFMREQGQIIMAHSLGVLWFPVRDNYILDISVAVIAASGLQALCNCGGVLGLQIRRSPYYPQGLVLACILVVVFSPLFNRQNSFYYFPGSGHTPMYYSNYLVADRVADYPFWNGIGKIREFARHASSGPKGRVMDIPNEFTYSFGPESFLPEGMGLVAMWESVIPKNYVKWSKYKNFGIRPEEHWWSYSPPHSEKTIRHLPAPNLLGHSAAATYLATLLAKPPLELNALRLLGVEYVAKLEPDPRYKSVHQASFMEETNRLGLQRIDKIEPVEYPNGAYGILRNTFYYAKLKDPFYRAFLVYGASSQDLRQELDPVVSEQFDSIEIKGKSYAVDGADITSYENEKVMISFKSETPAHLVLTDLDHPFWHVKIDGIEAAILPAFYIFRSVVVPAGTHKVSFYCEVPFMKSSVLISLITLMSVSLAWAGPILKRWIHG